jgi:hypothetical protein
VRKVLSMNFTDLGAQHVKNIQDPVRAFEAEPYRPLTMSREELHKVPFDPDTAPLLPVTLPSLFCHSRT